MFHEEPCNGTGVCSRWKIAMHCSTKRSWVEQFLAIFHRVLTPCHCTALSETFVLYDTSDVNESDPKPESLNIFPKNLNDLSRHFAYRVLLRHNRGTIFWMLHGVHTPKFLSAAFCAFNQSDCDNLGRCCTIHNIDLPSLIHNWLNPITWLTLIIMFLLLPQGTLTKLLFFIVFSLYGSKLRARLSYINYVIGCTYLMNNEFLLMCLFYPNIISFIYARQNADLASARPDQPVVGEAVRV